jgi:hypothetical protein
VKIKPGELYGKTLIVLGCGVVWGGMALLAVILLLRGAP